MSLVTKVLSQTYRLCMSRQWGHRTISTAAAPLCFKLTQMLGAEPLKKKKKLDPMIVRQKEERRKRKIEKFIRRLEKNAGQLKPIDELEIPPSLRQEIGIRKRPQITITEEIEGERSALLKEWSKYKYQQHLAEIKMIENIINSRDRALEELRQESEDLWLEAIQLDQMLLPFRAKGPVVTLPIKNYDPPDGEYIDKTKTWE